MLKKSIITLLCIALMAGSVNYRAYAEEIIIEEEISDEEEILSDELYIKEFSIKDIAPIKLWGGIIPEYNVISSRICIPSMRRRGPGNSFQGCLVCKPCT